MEIAFWLCFFTSISSSTCSFFSSSPWDTASGNDPALDLACSLSELEPNSGGTGSDFFLLFDFFFSLNLRSFFIFLSSMASAALDVFRGTCRRFIWLMVGSLLLLIGTLMDELDLRRVCVTCILFSTRNSSDISRILLEKWRVATARDRKS